MSPRAVSPDKWRAENAVRRERIESRLIGDAKEFILHVMSCSEGTAFTNKEDGLDPWGSLSQSWRQDRDVALASLTREHLKARDLPRAFRNDKDFLQKAIGENGNVWRGLSMDLALEPDLAGAILRFEKDLAQEVMLQISSFRESHEFWDKVIASGLDDIFGFMEKEAAPAILDDAELVVKACGQDHKNLSRVPHSLFQRKDFIAPLLEQAPIFLPHIPAKTQARFPEVIARTFRPYAQVFGTSVFIELVEHIDADLFEKKVVMRSWCAAGGPFVRGYHPRRWMNDENILLLIAKHCARKDAMAAFQYANPKSLSNKSFMCKAIKYNSWLYLYADSKLTNDFDVCLVAVAGSKAFTEEYAHDARFGEAFEELQEEVRLRLEEAESKPFSSLCASSLVEQACTAAILSSDAAAQYFEVPDADNVQLLHKASENLALALDRVVYAQDVDSLS